MGRDEPESGDRPGEIDNAFRSLVGEPENKQPGRLQPVPRAGTADAKYLRSGLPFPVTTWANSTALSKRLKEMVRHFLAQASSKPGTLHSVQKETHPDEIDVVDCVIVPDGDHDYDGEIRPKQQQCVIGVSENAATQ